MFTRKKRNYRTFIFSAVIVTLCLLIFAIAWPTETAAENDPETKTGEGKTDHIDLSDDDRPVSGETEQSKPELDEPDADAPDHVSSDEEINMEGSGKSYYLVKRAGDQIVVYFCNESGESVQLETTEILYDLLGPEDQKLFEEGIRVGSQEELGVLLQDFEG